MSESEVKIVTPKCRLCLKNDADQTGSHITSAFLIASQIGKRGEERSHVITTDSDQDYSENSGDHEIKEDHIFCRDCERRLSFIENIYSSEITRKIEDSKFKDNFPESNLGDIEFLTAIRINPIAFHLMIYTTLWRASISAKPIYQNLKFDETTEEDLRFTIDLFLPNVVDHKIIQSVESWNRMVENCQDLFSYFLYYILKAKNLEEKSQTFEFYDNISTDPYQIMINEYIILPFFSTLNHSNDFFEVKKYTNPALLNNHYEPPRIIVLSNEQYLAIIEMIRTLAVKQRIKEIEQDCIRELSAKGEPIVPEKIKSMIEERVHRISVPKPD